MEFAREVVVPFHVENDIQVAVVEHSACICIVPGTLKDEMIHANLKRTEHETLPGGISSFNGRHSVKEARAMQVSLDCRFHARNV